MDHSCNSAVALPSPDWIRCYGQTKNPTSFWRGFLLPQNPAYMPNQHPLGLSFCRFELMLAHPLQTGMIPKHLLTLENE